MSPDAVSTKISNAGSVINTVLLIGLLSEVGMDLYVHRYVNSSY